MHRLALGGYRLRRLMERPNLRDGLAAVTLYPARRRRQRGTLHYSDAFLSGRVSGPDEELLS
jgi:hypothetical protein